jgi:DNA-binding winged helix-turn-helix (wHTH) protein/tetratricopeptide (TPR) repeat protein
MAAEMPGDAPARFRFGRFAVDPARGLLLRDGQPVPLTRRTFETLLLLIRHRDRVVEKDELIAALWPDTIVEENNLAQHISVLRKLLGRDPAEPYVVTVSGRGYRFVAGIVEERARDGEEGGGEAVRHAAILPFQWLMPVPEAEYLGLALADALITRLSQIPSLRIRSTSAVRPYVEGAQDPAVIGQALGVEVLLQGTLQPCGRRVRLKPQLVSVADLSVIWAEIIEVDALDARAAEERIVEQVSRALGVRLPPRSRLAAGMPKEAHDAYLRGRYCLNRDGWDWLRRAVAHFERALGLYPDFPDAYAGLAQAHATLGFGYAREAPQAHFRRAREHAWQALSLDEQQAEAHAVLGQVAYLHDWDWAAAGREFDRALALDPNAGAVRHWRSQFLAAIGRTAEALSDIRDALELDPHAIQLNMHLGLTLLAAGDVEAAITQFRETLQLAPQSGGTHALLGWAYEEQGAYDAALAEMELASSLDPHPSWRLAGLARVHALAGRRAEACRLLAELLAPGGEVASPTCVAEVYSALGDHEQALNWLERAIEARDALVVYSGVSSRLAPLREHPRFGPMLARLGLDAYLGPERSGSGQVKAAAPEPSA